MTTLRLVYSAVQGRFAEEMASIRVPVAEAGTAAMRRAGEFVKTRARASIGAAGFSTRWQNALRVDVYPKGTTPSLRAAVHVYHRAAYAGVFEYGATINRGGGLLWIPISNTGFQKAGAKRMNVRDYIQKIGPLHPINTPGKAPVLAGYISGRAAKKGGKLTTAKLRAGNRLKEKGKEVQSVPVFYGIPQVNIRARFGVIDVVEQAQRNLAEYYIAALK